MDGFVQTRAGRVAYSDVGVGDPLVLLHASLHDRHDYDAVIGALAQTHRVIAVDWPAHGESDDPGPDAMSAPLLADVLEDVVTELRLGPAVFIGNSVGGFAAARLAVRHPERVAGLVLVNSGGFVNSNAGTRAFCRLMGTPVVSRLVMGAFIKGYMKAQTDNDRAVAARARARARTEEGIRTVSALWRSFATPEHDLRPDAGRVAAPTLIVWGGRDIAIPMSAGRTAHRLIAGSRWVTLPTGHVVFSSAPQKFLDAVTPFLGEVAARSRHSP